MQPQTRARIYRSPGSRARKDPGGRRKGFLPGEYRVFQSRLNSGTRLSRHRETSGSRPRILPHNWDTERAPARRDRGRTERDTGSNCCQGGICIRNDGRQGQGTMVEIPSRSGPGPRGTGLRSGGAAAGLVEKSPMILKWPAGALNVRFTGSMDVGRASQPCPAAPCHDSHVGRVRAVPFILAERERDQGRGIKTAPSGRKWKACPVHRLPSAPAPAGFLRG